MWRVPHATTEIWTAQAIGNIKKSEKSKQTVQKHTQPITGPIRPSLDLNVAYCLLVLRSNSLRLIFIFIIKRNGATIN